MTSAAGGEGLGFMGCMTPKQASARGPRCMSSRGQALPPPPHSGASLVWGFGFRVQGPGFRVQGSGFRVQGSGVRFQGSGVRVQGAGFRVQGSGFRLQGSGCSVQGLGFRVQGSAFEIRGPALLPPPRTGASLVCGLVLRVLLNPDPNRGVRV